ncbi:hypothetical protein JCM9140_3336 [Halalkalibacter wakoensis JCM 9140]|uniref:IDEAL domain-containing protein n=1 Tax=Halalkalibacter wakoensis JCM 9140 TaxID=1236970 RepID=W4Q747_9BACI|nr:sporulation histidine kinase inhibitor Sda [Halalkalibacter wakoensis]GAE27209.1 hypothetical protein JCM9140_3336 [Halalkalibacter wakoensis JCM 9140]
MEGIADKYEKGLAKVDLELLLEARENAIKLQLDPEFIHLLEEEINLREKENSQ